MLKYSCNNVASVTNLCLGRATLFAHLYSILVISCTFWVGTKKTLFTVHVWFFVNFARKVSLEIFDKSRPKWMNYLGSESEVFKKLNGSWSMFTRATSILKDWNVAKHLSRIHSNYGIRVVSPRLPVRPGKWVDSPHLIAINSLKKRLFAHLYSILVISCTFGLVQKKTPFYCSCVVFC
jgi:hypothetical protein